MHGRDFYLQLLTSEHRGRPQFSAVVQAITAAFVDNVDLTWTLLDKFDLDQATGAQLDAIGLWIGMFRGVAVPITGVYFAWDDTAATGWDNGYWQGPFDPSTGIEKLDDATFRTLMKAKIAANVWDGTFASMQSFWDYVFGAGVVTVQDNQDMTITLIYDSLALNTVTKSLLTQGRFPLKPAGVRITYTASTGAPIFSWDTNTPKFQGWNGVSVWAS